MRMRPVLVTGIWRRVAKLSPFVAAVELLLPPPTFTRTATVASYGYSSDIHGSKVRPKNSSILGYCLLYPPSL